MSKQFIYEDLPFLFLELLSVWKEENYTSLIFWQNVKMGVCDDFSINKLLDFTVSDH